MANGSAGRPPIDLFGRKYGYLLPIRSERVNGQTIWYCACVGGGGAGESACISKRGRNNLVPVLHTYLSSGGKRSCGCLSLHRGKKEKPYYVEASVGDYNAARIDAPLDKLARLMQMQQPEPTTQSLKGEVLGGFPFEDESGTAWILPNDVGAELMAEFDDTPEYWAKVEQAIDAAGRVKATN